MLATVAAVPARGDGGVVRGPTDDGGTPAAAAAAIAVAAEAAAEDAAGAVLGVGPTC